MRAVVPVLAALLGLSLVSLPAFAGELRGIVGTSVALEVPDGFVDGSAFPGFINNVINARIEGGSGGPNEAALFDGAGALDRMKAIIVAGGRMSIASAEQMPVAGQTAFVFEGNWVGNMSGKAWFAMLGPEHPAVLTFSQAGFPAVVANGLSREAVLQMLSTVVIAQPRATDNTVYASSIAVPLQPPFEGAKVRPDHNTIEIDTPAAGGPRLTVLFIAPYQYRPLAQAAQEALPLDSASEQLTQTTFIGMPAVRRTGTHSVGGKVLADVEYLAIVAGQPVLLVAEGTPEQMTDAVVASVDAIAQSIHRQSAAELQSAPEALNDK